jgi:hypothetical protein
MTMSEKDSVGIKVRKETEKRGNVFVVVCRE